MPGDLEKLRSLWDALRSIETPYRTEVDEFIGFLEGRNLGLTEDGIDEYLRKPIRTNQKRPLGQRNKFPSLLVQPTLKGGEASGSVSP